MNSFLFIRVYFVKGAIGMDGKSDKNWLDLKRENKNDGGQGLAHGKQLFHISKVIKLDFQNKTYSTRLYF